MTKQITLAELEDVSFSGLTAEEKDTAINWYYGDKNVVLSTSDNTVLTKLKKIAKASPGMIKIRTLNCHEDGTPYGITVELAKKLVKIATKASGGRELSPEEREKIAARLKASRGK